MRRGKWRQYRGDETLDELFIEERMIYHEMRQNLLDTHGSAVPMRSAGGSGGAV